MNKSRGVARGNSAKAGCCSRNCLVLAALLLAVLLVYAIPSSGYAGTTNKPVFAMDNHLLIMSSGKEFAAGEWQGAKLDENGWIIMDNKAGFSGAGMYISPLITSDPFKELVMSWNADTPPGTAIIVEAQLRIDGSWSPWCSWGKWCTWEKSGSGQADDNNLAVKMDIDTLAVKNDKSANALRYRIKLISNDAARTPAVKMVAATVKGVEKSVGNGDYARDNNDIVLEVPQYSQKLRDPKIAGRICSPTSMAMILNYYGISVLPEETAWNVMDYSGDVFGNWSFNCAYAASLGLKSYVAYYQSLADIKRDLLQGRPVAASVVYRNSESVAENLPVLHNAPIPATEGHLVVVRGFVNKDGQEYVVVNDPAAKDNGSVKRLYLAGEFEKAWTKVVYIVMNDNPAAVAQPARMAASLQYTGAVLNSSEGVQKSKAFLTVDGKQLDLSPEYVGSIVKIGDDYRIRFLTPDAGHALWISRQETGARILVITKQHKVYQAVVN